MSNFTQATAVAPMPTNGIFEMSEDERFNYMKAQGARNLEPPRPHSPCLKIKATGRVLPWNDLLAEQTALVECCDEEGNTDPSFWEHRVIPDDGLSVEERQQMIQAAQMVALTQATEISSGFYQPKTPHKSPPVELPHGAVHYDQFDSAAANAAMDEILKGL